MENRCSAGLQACRDSKPEGLHYVGIETAQCRNCELTNPDNATRCDCGFDFTSGAVKESYLTEKDKALNVPVLKLSIWTAVVGIVIRLAIYMVREKLLK